MLYISDELSHYGVKGMRWGVRKTPQSFGGRTRRALAGVYGINERYWRRHGNTAAASMQAYAKNQQLKKADQADKASLAKKKAKQQAKLGKQIAKENRFKVDVSKAKNSATRRVAEDTHKLSNKEFKAKYKSSKKTFAKRYERSNGDTFTMGRRKQALAVAYLDRRAGHSMAFTVADIARYDAASRGTQKAIDKGHNFSARVLSAVSDTSMKNRKDWNDLYYMPQSVRKKYGLRNK